MLTPNFTMYDLESATTPEALAHGRKLAAHVENTDWDEYSVWGSLPSEEVGIGELLVHHAGKPLPGACPCPQGHAAKLCAHLAALAPLTQEIMRHLEIDRLWVGAPF